MALRHWRKWLMAAGVFALLFAGMKYAFPLLLPFLAGTLLALGAEPLVRLLQGKVKLPRGVASGIGVGVTLVLLAALLTLLGALLVRELGEAAKALPDLGVTAQQGIDTLHSWLLNLAQKTPRGMRSAVRDTVDGFFQDGSVLMGQITRRVPEMVSAAVSKLPGSALGIGAAVLSGFLISIRLPKLRKWLSGCLPSGFYTEYLPRIREMRKALGQWFKAQAKLSAVTYGVVATGLMILGVQYGLLWAIPVALVDAVPMLGTGTILLPWALICFLQGDRILAIGLLIICAGAVIARAALEPRLIGRHLGLDPLLTLVALYLGYRLWGIAGMVLTPLLATAAKALCTPAKR